MRPRRYVFLRAALVLTIVLAAWLARGRWLPWFGTGLVRSQAPEKADIAVVLGGDATGNRILKGAELVRAGFVPQVLVSGPDGFYDGFESDYEIAFAIRRGYPKSMFVSLPHRARSTREEAQLVIAELRRRGVKRYLLVTSETHTRRAAALFQKTGPELAVVPVAAPSPRFTPAEWWREREGQKAVLLEWMKTAAGWAGL